jgi:DNA uptake protein ComE-like DNA-binding protein
MRRVAIFLSATGLVVGLAGGWLAGQAASQGEAKMSPSLTVATKPARIDVNRADREELGRLPGMTLEAADRIIQNRPYRRLDELLSKKVIGKKQFAQIREYIIVGPGGM